MKCSSMAVMALVFFISCGKTDIERLKDNEKTSQTNLRKKIESGKVISRIDVRVRAEGPELKDHPDGRIPWIDIAGYERFRDRIVNGDDIIWNGGDLVLVIDYPLTRPYREKISFTRPDQRTLRYVISIVCDRYQKIYREEEKSSSIKVIPLKERKKLLNRNETNGKYGIWGHDIEDLSLTSISIIEVDGRLYLDLDIDS